MPLIKSGSKQAMSNNISTEMKAGRPQKQAIAIAYATKRKAGKRKKMASGGMVSEMFIDPLDGQDANADALSEEMTTRKRDTMEAVMRAQADAEGSGHKASRVGGDKPHYTGIERTFADGGEVDDGEDEKEGAQVGQLLDDQDQMLKHGVQADPQDPYGGYARGGLVDNHSSYGNENQLLGKIKGEMGSKSMPMDPIGNEDSIKRKEMMNEGSKASGRMMQGDDENIVASIMRNRGMKSASKHESYGEQDQMYADGGPVDMDDDWDAIGQLHDGSGEMYNEHTEAPELRKWVDENPHQMARGGLVESIMKGRMSKKTPLNDNPNEFQDEEPKDDFSLSHTVADPEHDVDDMHNDKGIISQIMTKRKMSKRSRS